MRTFLKGLFIAYILFIPLDVFSQNDSVRTDFVLETCGIASNGKINALYSYSNIWGTVDPFVNNQAFVHASVKSVLLNSKFITCKAGLGIVGHNHFSSNFLHEAYLRGKILFVDYSLGKEAFSPVAINDSITTGMFLNSANCAPYPRILLGVFNYFPVPFTNGWVEFKGGIAQSVLDDNRESYGKSFTLMHDKYFYLRMGHTFLQPYAGVYHSALFGGKDPSGNKIGIDFWSTFLAQGSDKLGGGEATNAAGAHMGLYDFGFYATTKAVDFQFYYQKPIRDGSSLYLNKGRNQDHVLGVIAKIKRCRFVKEISLELTKTIYQSGAGVLDIAYPAGNPKAGQLIFPANIENFDKFMLNELGIEVHGWDEDTFINYFQKTYNQGYRFGGRDNYMNNGFYYKGWSYRGQSMGGALLHTADQYIAYSGRQTEHFNGYFVNNRVLGYHIGLSGNIFSNLDYLAKFTVTKNYGSYQEEFAGAMSWEKTPNYFYESSLTEQYSYLELKYSNIFGRKIAVMCFGGYDWGDLYYSFTGGVSFICNLSL